jgi:hypothetical protein
MADPIVALYVYGVFDSGYAGEQQTEEFSQYISEIQSSAFNVVILSTFHVDTLGNLFGSVPLVTNGVFNPNWPSDQSDAMNPVVPSLYQALAASGRTLLYSIGNSAGTAGDMAALQQILAAPGSPAYQNLSNNIQILAQNLSISGVDFDFEPSEYSETNGETVVAFTNFVNELGLQVTYCPYMVEQFWLDAQAQAYANAGSSQPVVSWYNLQCYSGGAGNSPADWVQAIESYGASKLGIDNPAAFIVAGYDLQGGPSGVQDRFALLTRSDPGINGGFLWQLGDMVNLGPNAVAEYGAAVANGLAGQSA